MKKVFSRPSLKVYPVKHHDIICGSGSNNASLGFGSQTDTPTPGTDGFIWGE